MCDLPSHSYKAMIGYYINRRGNAAYIRMGCLGVRKVHQLYPLQNQPSFPHNNLVIPA